MIAIPRNHHAGWAVDLDNLKPGFMWSLVRLRELLGNELRIANFSGAGYLRKDSRGSLLKRARDAERHGIRVVYTFENADGQILYDLVGLANRLDTLIIASEDLGFCDLLQYLSDRCTIHVVVSKKPHARLTRIANLSGGRVFRLDDPHVREHISVTH